MQRLKKASFYTQMSGVQNPIKIWVGQFILLKISLLENCRNCYFFKEHHHSAGQRYDTVCDGGPWYDSYRGPWWGQ